ncbi:PREDICTED: uncharacterized protein LOC109592142 [Amphimedon queenslandica]|uniref:Uncharacterized protein n=1 Tax=Amphimedon queenslandica TaxID=400682 RepID=A0AAN0K1L4_AMPQE|nr:PREDICTED: uncharacterized protein LOC109592142 [Amphimedon queenslandica]|eukprot:XP_019863239.1 PREDICTED: uncharacterized protein LOC109592142 [Amphimedon queenslandica]
MTVLTTIAMASKIKSGQSILIDGQKQPNEVHYYLPLARTRAEYVPLEEENDYAFIEIESVNFPANVQACISYAIMDNNDDAVLIATDYSNISRFLFQSTSGPPIKIEMIYKGSKTRLRIMNSSMTYSHLQQQLKCAKKLLLVLADVLTEKLIRYVTSNTVLLFPVHLPKVDVIFSITIVSLSSVMLVQLKIISDYVGAKQQNSVTC